MKITILLFLFVPLYGFAQGSIRHVPVRRDEIVRVRTSLGIATIVQLPMPVKSAIIGDQSAFKIQFLGRSVAIKPLRFNAATNLYLQTKNDRYNLRLAAVARSLADYVVYLQRAKPKVTWERINLRVENQNLIFDTRRIGHSPNELLFDLVIVAKKRVHLEPQDFWLIQDKKSKPIQYLYLDRLTLRPQHFEHILMAVNTRDLDRKQNVQIELRNHKAVDLVFRKDLLWR